MKEITRIQTIRERKKKFCYDDKGGKKKVQKGREEGNIVSFLDY